MLELLAAAILLLSPGDQATLRTVTVEAQPFSEETYGAYAFESRRIEVNDAITDPAVVAAILTHELVHVRQHDTGDFGPGGCGGVEIPAYQAEARFWLSLYGPEGRSPTDRWISDLNRRAAAEYRGEIAAYVHQVYAPFCSPEAG